MKLKDLKEWGGRDLPGFGDEATWDGRSPEGDDAEPQSQMTPTSELAQEYLFVDPRAIAHLNGEKEITEYLGTCGFTKVVNDTGHQFVPAIKHALKPMVAVLASGEIATENLPALAQMGETMPEEVSITEIQRAARKWAALASK